MLKLVVFPRAHAPLYQQDPFFRNRIGHLSWNLLVCVSPGIKIKYNLPGWNEWAVAFGLTYDSRTSIHGLHQRRYGKGLSWIIKQRQQFEQKL